MVRDKTGLLLDPYFSATKLAWLLAHLPARAALRRDRGGALRRAHPHSRDGGRSAGRDLWPGLRSPGLVKNTYGTGSFLLMNPGDKPAASRARLLTTIAWQLGAEARPTYALEGSIFVTGAAVQRLRDALGLIRDAAATEVLARSVPDMPFMGKL